MTLTKQTLVVMKSKYKKLLRKFMSVSDRFEVQYAAYDEALAKLCAAHEKLCYARSKLEEAKNMDGVTVANLKLSQVEEKIKVLHKRMQELKAKESEYTAKIESAVAVNEAMRVLNDTKSQFGSTDNIDSIVSDCEEELKRLDAEFRTLTFIGGLD